jgi:hypothetical protein
MSESTPNPSLSPIRIYVLWHPDMDKSHDPAHVNRGITLARRIYHWFRLETMDGIPVYFRSHPAGENPEAAPLEIRNEPGVRNYIIPLIDAHMVSSPEWRKFVSDLALENDDASRRSMRSKEEGRSEMRIFPVAMESVAYNMPESLKKLNFIRHVGNGEAQPDNLELLSRLSEAICRDLRFWLRRRTDDRPDAEVAHTIPAKIKIFLSHAKADSTSEAIALKEHIQRETQCEAFFDETDIACGYDFSEILGSNLSEESSGLIVIQGDNYADRPWCRKEIRDFLKPVRETTTDKADRYFIPPVVVVQTMKGRQLGRTIAELGYAPCARWNEKDPATSARFVVTTLLREILFGLFYRVLARCTAEAKTAAEANGQVYINRAPDPVMINRIVKDRGLDSPISEVLHPGYGLSKMEREGLEASVPTIRFTPFLDVENPFASAKTPLSGSVIAISAGNSDDILSFGMGDEHVKELLVRLVRPIVSAGASLLYGGKMPESLRPEKPWGKRVDFMAALLQTIITERDSVKDASQTTRPPRLFIPVAWHAASTIDAQKIALWTDICSFAPGQCEDSGIRTELLPKSPVPPDEADLADDTPHERRERRQQYATGLAEYDRIELAKKALSISAMRRKICDTESPLLCRLPDAGANDRDGRFRIRTTAHILIGGKTRGFSGIMPGVFEEALYAFEAGKPVFLIVEGGGAAAMLARWLVNFKQRPKLPPADFKVDLYREATGKPSYSNMLVGLKHEAFSSITSNPPGDALNELWKFVRQSRDPESLSQLLKNGLTPDDNFRLLYAARRAAIEQKDLPPSTQEICGLVWKGIFQLNP